MLSKTLLFALILMLFQINAHALIYSNSKETYKAVIKLESIDGNGLCSGTVVGFNPPTVITARHCVEMGAFLYKNIGPDKMITESFHENRFSVGGAKLPGDMAVIMYPRSSEQEFRKAMSQDDLFDVKETRVQAGQKVQLCGYGSTGPVKNEIAGMGVQRCGQNFVILGDSKRRAIPLKPNELFDQYDQATKIQYIFDLIQSYIGEYGNETRFGLGIDEARKMSLTQWGDSGGPMFIKDENGRKQIIAISSGILNVGSQGMFIGGFFWRLDHQWSREFLRKAVNMGADINGFL
jgi:hypothetical protein